VKTYPIDFLLAGLSLSSIFALALVVTACILSPISLRLLGEYHVIADVLLLLLNYGLISALAVRLLVKFWPLRQGTYSMNDSQFTRWKLFTVLYEFGRGALVPFTTVFAKPLVVKMFGANMGRYTAFAGHINEPPLISVGDGAILGQDCVITAHAITSGHIILREVKIGKGATVGINVVIMPGAEVGDDAVIAACSVVAMGTKIPAGELWGGIPARKIKDIVQSDVKG
jgi:hypothetical protein